MTVTIEETHENTFLKSQVIPELTFHLLILYLFGAFSAKMAKDIKCETFDLPIDLVRSSYGFSLDIGKNKYL